MYKYIAGVFLVVLASGCSKGGAFEQLAECKVKAMEELKISAGHLFSDYVTSCMNAEGYKENKGNIKLLAKMKCDKSTVFKYCMIDAESTLHTDERAWQ